MSADAMPVPPATDDCARSWLGPGAVAGWAVFLTLVVVLHLLRADINPLAQPISSYALGPFGFLMTTAYVAAGLGQLSLVCALRRTLGAGPGVWLALGLLMVAGVCPLLLAIFPSDGLPVPVTTAGSIHRLAVQGFLLTLVAGTLLLSWHFRRNQDWSDYAPVSLGLAFVALALTVLYLAVQQPETMGLRNRLVVIAGLAWAIITALRVRSLPLNRVGGKR